MTDLFPCPASRLTYKGLLPRVISKDLAVEAFQDAVSSVPSSRRQLGKQSDPEISFQEFTDLVQRLLPRST